MKSPQTKRKQTANKKIGDSMYPLKINYLYMNRTIFITYILVISILLLANNISIAGERIVYSNFEVKKFESKTINQGGRKTKDGRYKRKKGFLWGLFKGKKECDCPKH